MKVPYLNLPRQFSDKALWKEIKRVMASCQFVMGEDVKEFETRLASLCGVRHAIGVNSCTDAIFLALKVLGIGPGHEVITVPNSFVATANAVLAAGARPVFVDVGDDYNLDVSLLEKAISPRTRAILPVHLTGLMADMERINDIAARHRLHVIEDSAQAVMASIRGRRAGAWGVVGCFSLHPLKNLNVCGDGGAMTTDSDELAEKLKLLRNHGLKDRDSVVLAGYNSRLDSLKAAVAIHGMKTLREVTEARNRNAAQYRRELAGVKGLRMQPVREGWEHVYHTFVMLVDRRDELREFLAKKEIETKIHYPIPIHYQAPYRSLGFKEGDFPVCERQAVRLVTLPVNQYLEPEQISFVSKAVRDFYAKGKGK